MPMVKIKPILGGALGDCCALDRMANAKNNASVSDKTRLSVINVGSIRRQVRAMNMDCRERVVQSAIIAKDNHTTLQKFVGVNSELNETYLTYLREQWARLGLTACLFATCCCSRKETPQQNEKKEIEAI